MANEGGRYVHQYDVPFLDDLHNYFPAILYDPAAFVSVQDLLFYIQSQMRRRFDLFSRGQEAYNSERRGGIGRRVEQGAAPVPAPVPAARAFRTASGPGPGPGTSVPRPTPLPRGGVHPILGTTVTPPVRVVTQPIRRNLFDWGTIMASDPFLTASLETSESTNPFLDTTALNLLTTLLNATNVPSQTLEPVVVRLTQQQIQDGSTIETVDSEDEMCAICQDRIPAGSQARKLTVCGHRFHVGCIDTWFQRDVHCPMCRFDIRERGGQDRQEVQGPQEHQEVDEESSEDSSEDS